MSRIVQFTTVSVLYTVSIGNAHKVLHASTVVLHLIVILPTSFGLPSGSQEQRTKCRSLLCVTLMMLLCSDYGLPRRQAHGQDVQ